MAVVDWHLLRREPLGLIFMLFVPLAVVSVLGPIYVAEDAGDQRVAVVREGDGPVGELVERRLEASKVLEVASYGTRAAAAEALRLRKVDGVVVIPPEVDAGRAADVVLIGPPQLQVPHGVRAELERAVAETTAIRMVAGSGGSDGRGTEAARIDRAEEEVASVAVSSDRQGSSAQRRTQGALSAAVVAVVVLFTFTNAMARSAGVRAYQELGIVARMRVAGMPAHQVAAGFALTLASFALVQVGVALLAGTFVLGVAWGSVWPLAAVAVAVGICAGALGTLTGSFLPSSTSGVTIAGPAGFLLGMVGGALWPLEIVPPLARTIGHLVPQAWAVDGLLAAGGLAQTGAWLAPTAVLVVYATALAALASLRLRAVLQGGR